MPTAPDTVSPSSPTGKRPLLSAILPMYNEAGNLARLFERLEGVLGRLRMDYEIICIDDGSRDGTFEALLFHRLRNPRIKPVRLSRNFGKEAAMAAGLERAAGAAVVLLDSDLQHPPELIEAMVAHWRDGAEMVYARRTSRDTDGWLRRTLTRAYYRLYRALSEVDLPPGAGDFRLLDRRVVDAIIAMPERRRFLKGMMAWVGFRQVAIPYEPEARHAGSSTWNFWRLFTLAFDGLASFTTLPLRIWSVIGLFVALVAMAYGGVIAVRTLVYGVDVPGYASLMVATLFLGGVQLICLGVLGDYLGRVFEEVKRRPVYLVAEAAGFGEAEQTAAKASPPVLADPAVPEPARERSSDTASLTLASQRS
ncbi:glycosyltransferase family 2 protein [Rhodospirillum centenum]|nr:glycosyltransferase family 2 protein [Rhodospirillum centenum]